MEFNMNKLFTARPEENIAFIEFTADGQLSSYVTLGSITCRANHYYEQIDSSLLAEVELQKYPISEFKYEDGKIYRPIKLKIFSQLRKVPRVLKAIAKKTYNSYSLKIFSIIISLSIFASAASSFITAHTLKFLGITNSSNNGDLLTIFIPILAIFTTMIGIGITLLENRKLHEKQRRNLIRPELSFFDSENENQDFRRTIFPGINGITYIAKAFTITNIGNGLAKNLMFFQYDEHDRLIRSHVQIKRLLPSEVYEISIALADDDKIPITRLFSKFEDTDGNKVIQLHLFTLLQTNDNSHHLNDLVLDPLRGENRSIYNQLT